MFHPPPVFGPCAFVARALVLSCCAPILAAQETAILRFDFGSPRSRAAGLWNHVTTPGEIGVVVPQAVTTDGRASSVALRQLDSWSGWNGDGSGVDAPFPAAAGRDSFYLDAARAAARLRLDGLQPEERYTLRLFGSRKGRDRGRETLFELDGQTARLDAADNDDRVVSLRGQADRAGRLLLTVHRPEGQDFAYLGVLEVQGRIPSGPPPRDPADTVDGPPLVSARGWIVADEKTGKSLFGHEVDRSLECASTTKIMTALLVIEAAREEPGLPEQRVVVSLEAARQGGTRAGLVAGQTWRVHDLLCGLLLPSGNDAAVALAEHVGARGRRDRPLASFVERMNERARQLGMRDTRYDDPHGNSRNRTSAADLVRLTRRALVFPTFREITASLVHVATVEDPDGEQRKVVWTNTNQLLRIDGYDGVKTGWTRGAGGCLVARGARGDRRLLVVVLGSRDRELRFLDARSLFRWAWRELEGR